MRQVNAKPIVENTFEPLPTIKQYWSGKTNVTSIYHEADFIMSVKDKIRSIQGWLAGISAITLAVGGMVFGILFWSGFNWSMELTNTEQDD